MAGIIFFGIGSSKETDQRTKQKFGHSIDLLARKSLNAGFSILGPIIGPPECQVPHQSLASWLHYLWLTMPRISEFYGIVILMYWFDTQKHKMPHFHARYRGVEAAFDLNGNPIEGTLSPTTRRLIKKWCQQNSRDIKEAWEKAKKGKELPWIKPLP